MAIITQLDACTPGALKAPGLPKAQRVAGYLDGPCQWPGSGWSEFPGVPKVRITDRANDLADVFDYERGTASLRMVRGAVVVRARVYLPSAVYVAESNWETALGDLQGLPVVWWVAAWGASTWPVLRGVGGHIIKAAAWQEISMPDWDLSHVDDVAWPVLGEPAP